MEIQLSHYIRGENTLTTRCSLDELYWEIPPYRVNSFGDPVMTQERLGEILRRQNRFVQLWEDSDQNIIAELVYERV